MAEKHFTATAFIISTEVIERVLFIYHKKLDCWLPPGGHIEHDEEPVTAVSREVLEETGIDITSVLPKITQVDSESRNIPLPDYFIEETIPAHGQNPLHYHLDLIYIVKIQHGEGIKNEKEHDDIRWFTKKETLHIKTKENVRQIIEEQMKE